MCLKATAAYFTFNLMNASNEMWRNCKHNRSLYQML